MRNISRATCLIRNLTGAGLVAATTVAMAPAFAWGDSAQIKAQEQDNHVASSPVAQVALADSGPEMETLQLDHGPRATTTPWANEQRKLRNQQRKLRDERAARAAAQASAPTR